MNFYWCNDSDISEDLIAKWQLLKVAIYVWLVLSAGFSVQTAYYIIA